MRKLYIILSSVLIVVLSSVPYLLFCQPVLYGLTYAGGEGVGSIIKYESGTNSLTAAFAFPNLTRKPSQNGAPLQASNGKIYGMTRDGGSYDYGTIFSFDPLTNTLAIVHSFNNTDGNDPQGSLMQASDGKLYGMTGRGGTNDDGTIFSFDPLTNTLVKLFDFNYANGGEPGGSLIQADNGTLYGVAGGGSNDFGTIFSFDPLTNTYAALHAFDYTNGVSPEGSLLQASDGKLYGMTSYGGTSDDGTIFSFDIPTNTHTKLYDLDEVNGAQPFGSLMQATDGKLYGMTVEGGSNDEGTIFSFDPLTNIQAKLYDFDYTNGSSPWGSLVQAGDGKLYGMTSRGGTIDDGTIFSLDILTNELTKLYNFDYTYGDRPMGSLLQAGNGKMYATTYEGGSGGYGTFFSFDPITNTHALLHDFNYTNGAHPYGSLIQAANGKLYGTTSDGVTSGNGTIFSFDPITNTQAILHEFDHTDGRNPRSSLVQASNGKLYGMGFYGGGLGPESGGTIFSFDPLTNTHTKLYTFTYPGGTFPHGSLIQAADGKLYGMTFRGGANDAGTIFSFDPLANTHTKLYDLDNASGSRPYGSLVQAGNGMLYGMTSEGGSANVGTVFSFDPLTNTLTKLYDFDHAHGAYPYGSLIHAGDGQLYGMTQGGGTSDHGTIFSFDPLTNTLIKLHDFDYGNGAWPRGSLMQASDGKLYGMTNYGGSNGHYGVVFNYDIANAVFTKLQEFNEANGAHPEFGALLEVNVCPSITATIAAGATAACQQAASPDLTFTASGGTAPYTFTYTVNADTQTVTTTSGNAVSVAVPTDVAGNLQYELVSVKDAGTVQCLQTITGQRATVTINPLPVPTITAAAFVCSVSLDNIASVANAGAGAAYIWTISGGLITSGFGTNSIKYMAGISGSVKLNITVTNSNGCKASANKKITITAWALPLFVQIKPVCKNATAPALPSTSTNGITGTWSPSTINTAVLGTTIYTFTPAPGQCAIPTIMKIRVKNCSSVSDDIPLAGKRAEMQMNKPALDVLLLPNPSQTQFTLVIKGNRKEVAEIRVFDMAGRRLEYLKANTRQQVQFGKQYRSGMYVIEVLQGTDRKLIKAIKE